MASKGEDRHDSVNSPVTGVIPSIVKRKRDLQSGSSQDVHVKQIHPRLTETLSVMKPTDPSSTSAIDQLKIAQMAVAKAYIFLTAASQEQPVLDKTDRSGQQLTMIERAELFHQWRVKRGEVYELQQPREPLT